MVYQYVVVIKNQNTRYINLMGLLLCLLSAVLFLKELLAARQLHVIYLIGVIFIAGVLIWNYIIYKRGNSNIYFSKGLLIAALVWSSMPYWQGLLFVFIVLALLEYQAKHPLEIGFATQQIVFNTFFRKRYEWIDVTNVLLKDGLLTMDFANNRLFQREIDEGESEASEEEFNAWCSERLVVSNKL